MVPERLWSGVNELPTGLPTGVRPAGGAKADRVPTADVGAPINRPGAATGVGTGGVPCARDATGTPAAITAPTVPAIPSSASRRVMCSLSFGESTGADTGVASWQSVRGAVAYPACGVACTEAGNDFSRSRPLPTVEKRAGTGGRVGVLLWRATETKIDLEDRSHGRYSSRFSWKGHRRCRSV